MRTPLHNIPFFVKDYVIFRVQQIIIGSIAKHYYGEMETAKSLSYPLLSSPTVLQEVAVDGLGIISLYIIWQKYDIYPA